MESPGSIHLQKIELSETGQALIALTSKINLGWENLLRQNIPAAQSIETALLTNSLPIFLKYLAEVMTKNFPRETVTGHNNLAREHGRERARLTSYNLQELVMEYKFLKEAILYEICDARRLSLNDRSLIDAAILDAIGDCVLGFSEHRERAQQKFIAALSHDIRNPLSTVIMAAEIVEAGSAKNGAELNKIILSNANKALELLNDLLDSTAVSVGGRIRINIEACELSEIVSECLAAYTLNKSIKIEAKMQTIIGSWSRREISRAIDNLLSNAVKYGDTSKPIGIEISALDGRVFIAVHNDGEPIPEEEHGHIFEAFKRAHAAEAGNTGGWGIGLALVKGIAEAHGGSVLLDSSAERGTTFTIGIPKDASFVLDTIHRNL